MHEKIKLFFRSSKAFFAVHILLSAVFLALLYSRQVLPFRYYACVLAMVVFFIIISLALRNWKKGSIPAGLVLSILTSLILAAGIYYLIRIDSTLSVISTIKEDRNVYNVMVRMDDKAQGIEDIAGYTTAVMAGEDKEQLDKVLSQIEQAAGGKLNPVEYESAMDEVWALTGGEVDAIIYNEAYSGTLDDEFEDYYSMVRSVYQTEITVAVEKPAPDQPEEEISSEKEESGETVVGTESFTVYISGIDVSGSINTKSRSDVNMLVTVNRRTHVVLMTSTPRDYYVDIPGVTSENVKDKLTHAGIYGIESSMETLENLYDVEIDDYIRANFTSVVEIVDALGGIDLYNEKAFTSIDGFEYKKGNLHLDGIYTLNFARERNAFEDGDVQRGQNQQLVLSAIIDKAITPEVLLHTDELLEIVKKYFHTSITNDEMYALVNRQLDERADWTILTQSAVGYEAYKRTASYGRSKLYVMIPDEEVVEWISENIKGVISGEITDELPAAPETEATKMWNSWSENASQDSEKTKDEEETENTEDSN